jgi:tetratricopeptide (TPR) repeat protein
MWLKVFTFLFSSSIFLSFLSPSHSYLSSSLPELSSFSCCQHIDTPDLLNDCFYSHSTQPSTSKHKIALVSYATPDILNYSAYSHGINLFYSQLNHYDFYLLNTTGPYCGQYDQRDERWNKIKILQTGFETWGQQYDYLIWIDADAIVLNFQFHFEDIIQLYPLANLIVSAENYEILISNLFTAGGSVNRMNSGVIIVKNTKWTAKFLAHYWDHSNRTKFSDQTVFDFIYLEYLSKNETEITSSVIILPPHILNSNSPVPMWFKPYQSVLHLLGEHSLYRQYVFHQILRSICLLQSPSNPPLPSAGVIHDHPPSPKLNLKEMEINNVVLNVTSRRLAEWYLEIIFPVFQEKMAILIEQTKLLQSFQKLPPQEIGQKVEDLRLPKNFGTFIHVSTRIAGALIFTPPPPLSPAQSQSLKLSPQEFVNAFFQSPSPLSPLPPSEIIASNSNAELLLLKAFRTLRNFVNALRPLNEAYSHFTKGQQNISGWYYHLHLTGMLGEFVCSLPSQREKASSLILSQVQDLYHEIHSFPTPPGDSPLSTKSSQFKALGLLQYYQLLLNKKRNPKQLPDLTLELEMEFNFMKSYEIYEHLSGKYGRQGLWMVEGMLGISSCEIRRYEQAEFYFQRAMKTMSPLGEIDFSYGILLKYYGECLLRMNRVEESEEILRKSVLIHRINEIPLSHVTYQHLYEIRQQLQQEKSKRKNQTQREEVKLEL